MENEKHPLDDLKNDDGIPFADEARMEDHYDSDSIPCT